jgi:hypothetical protein
MKEEPLVPSAQDERRGDVPTGGSAADHDLGRLMLL